MKKKILLGVLILCAVIIASLGIRIILFIHDTSYKEPELTLSSKREYNSTLCIVEDVDFISDFYYPDKKPIAYYKSDGKFLSSKYDCYLAGSDEVFFQTDGYNIPHLVMSYIDDNFINIIISHWESQLTTYHEGTYIDAHKYDEAFIYDRNTKTSKKVYKTDDKKDFLVDYSNEYYVIYDRDNDTITKYSVNDDSVVQRVDVSEKIYKKNPINFVLKDDVCIEFNENNCVDVFKDWVN